MIDIRALAEALEFDIEDVKILLELFVENAQVSLANIEDAIETNDIQAIQNEAHAIKGSASNLMLADIQDMARDMENAARENRKINYLSLYSQIEEKIEILSEVQTSYA
ncbi:MAG TPA: Hpt domain-containing protein [Campylobacterales bacterium]|nr:Hpt domain-containing protein [Campylobacterales bacterium]